MNKMIGNEKERLRERKKLFDVVKIIYELSL